MSAIKPHLACDIDFDTIPDEQDFIAMPKIDGCRGIYMPGATQMTGRSLEPHANPHITARFSLAHYEGFDGEIATGDIRAFDLCRKTSGDCARESADSHYDATWWLFDWLHPTLLEKTYKERLDALWEYVQNSPFNAMGIRLVPYTVLRKADMQEFHQECLKSGYEGSVFRDPLGLHKSGRASSKVTKKSRGNAYLRMKDRISFEFVITELVEAKENKNEKKTNALGQSERSTHQENMVPKGVVGTILGTAIADVEWMGKVLIKKDDPVTIGPGKMTHAERKAFWDYRDSKELSIIGCIGKADFMPHGQKDKPRQPTWDSLRAKQDMSEG